MATNTTLKTKDPNAVLDYQISWASWLGTSETISSSDWIVDSGITKDTASNTTTTATIWLSGGTDKIDYTVTNRITTNQGRTNDQSLLIQVRQR